MSRQRQKADVAVTAWGHGYVLIGLALATAIAMPVYESLRVPVIAIVGFTVATVAVAISRRFGWAGWALALTALLSFVVAVVPLAVPLGLAGFPQFVRALRDGVAGIVLGWKQLLTLSLPLGEYQAVLVPWLVVALFGTVLALALSLRPDRVSALAAPVVIAMGAFGIVFGSSVTSDPLQFGFVTIPAPREVLLFSGLIAVSVTWLIGRTRLIRARALRIARAKTGTVRQRRESVAVGFRRNALGAILVLVAIAVATVVTPIAAAISPRQALRDAVEPVLVVRSQPSPLSSYRSWFDDGSFSTKLFTVTGDTTEVGRIRLATLDSFDGETFHVSGAGADEATRFSRLPRTTPASATDAQITITIDEGYSGIWVPVPDALSAAPSFSGSRAESLADGFYVNDDGATAVDVAPTAGGSVGLQSGDTYRVYSSGDASESSIGDATGGTTLIDDAQYPTLVDWAKAQRVPRDGEGLMDLIQRLRSRGYLSHSTLPLAEGSTQLPEWARGLGETYPVYAAYSGHSRARVELLFDQLLSRERSAGVAAEPTQLVAGIGDDEQFATAGALLARHFGFDSRVVVGVRLTTTDESLPIATCAQVCTGGNMSAWIEVRAQGGGWTPIDTTPQAEVEPQRITEGIELPKNPTQPEESTTDVIDAPQVDRNDNDATPDLPANGNDWLIALLPVLRAIGITLLTVVLLVLPALVIAIAKRSRRTYRRSSRVPEVSVVGAWDELVDLYVDLGVPMPRAATRLELAEAAERPGAIALATQVDRAVFAEHPPMGDARTASWQLLDAERDDLLADRTFLQRLRAQLSLASFVRQVDKGSALATIISVFNRKQRKQS